MPRRPGRPRVDLEEQILADLSDDEKNANRHVVVIPLLRSIRQDDRGRDDKRGLARVH
jgi:hypothetical protein